MCRTSRQTVTKPVILLTPCNSSAATVNEAKIIAGKDSSQIIFKVPIKALKRSSVISGYIEDPESMPRSLQKDGALYLPHCDAEVVRTLIHCLRRDEYSVAEYKFQANVISQDPLFYVKTYKLGMSLA